MWKEVGKAPTQARVTQGPQEVCGGMFLEEEVFTPLT